MAALAWFQLGLLFLLRLWINLNFFLSLGCLGFSAPVDGFNLHVICFWRMRCGGLIFIAVRQEVADFFYFR